MSALAQGRSPGSVRQKSGAPRRGRAADLSDAGFAGVSFAAVFVWGAAARGANGVIAAASSTNRRRISVSANVSSRCTICHVPGSSAAYRAVTGPSPIVTPRRIFSTSRHWRSKQSGGQGRRVCVMRPSIKPRTTRSDIFWVRAGAAGDLAGFCRGWAICSRWLLRKSGHNAMFLDLFCMPFGTTLELVRFSKHIHFLEHRSRNLL